MGKMDDLIKKKINRFAIGFRSVFLKKKEKLANKHNKRDPIKRRKHS